MKLATKHINFLEIEIGQGKITLQRYITTKILSFLDKLEDIKTLRTFLGLLNYARSYLKDIEKNSGVLYNKTSTKGQRYFNREVVKKIKNMVKVLPTLTLPLDKDYLVIEIDGCELDILVKNQNTIPKLQNPYVDTPSESIKRKGI